MLEKRFRASLSISLCLFFSSALLQGSTAAQTGSYRRSAETSKPFTFEVFPIRPHKPGTDLIGWEYTPDGFKGSMTLDSMIIQAYVPQPPYLRRWSQIEHAPDWIGDWYDINARIAPEDMAAWQKAQVGRDSELQHEALRAALKECCNLALHLTPVQIPYWNIVADKHGAKLKQTVSGAIKSIPGKTDAVGQGFCIHEGQQVHFVGVTIEEFAITLTRMTKEERPIQDKTGLPGRYDFTLPWYDERLYPASEIGDPLDRMPLANAGLKLQRGTGPSFIVTIDHVEKPAPN